MPTRVLLTIDIELVWRRDDAGDDWRALLARSFDPAGVGIPYQLRRLAAHGLKAIFFVDPMPARRFGIEPIKRMVGPILDAGQDVQLHLHPNWADDAHGFEMSGMAEAAQRDLIAQGAELLVAAGAPAPIAFRAGNYAADDATLRALASLGIAYDSSHNGSHAPWPSAIGLPSGQIAPIAHEGVIELPVTQIAEGAGLRHLQICAVSSMELRAALDHAVARGHAAATIVSHSFELASRNAARPNTTHLRRFEALCDYLEERRTTLPTAWFTGLGDLPLDQGDAPMPADALRGALRRAEQCWSNWVHERRA